MLNELMNYLNDRKIKYKKLGSYLSIPISDEGHELTVNGRTGQGKYIDRSSGKAVTFTINTVDPIAEFEQVLRQAGVIGTGASTEAGGVQKSSNSGCGCKKKAEFEKRVRELRELVYKHMLKSQLQSRLQQREVVKEAGNKMYIGLDKASKEDALKALNEAGILYNHIQDAVGFWVDPKTNEVYKEQSIVVHFTKKPPIEKVQEIRNKLKQNSIFVWLEGAGNDVMFIAPNTSKNIGIGNENGGYTLIDNKIIEIAPAKFSIDQLREMLEGEKIEVRGKAVFIDDTTENY